MGDFGYDVHSKKGSKELDKTVRERWKKLPCKKILIRGNHDQSWVKDLFDETYETPVFYNGSRRILLSHEPFPTSPGVLNVHGHLHGAILSLNNHYCISMHMVNYQLLTSKALFRKLGELPKDSIKFMEEWWTPYYVSKIKNKE